MVAGTALVRRALPQRCVLCVAPAHDALLCDACEQRLPRLPPACPVCALPHGAIDVCNACASRPPPFAATVAALVYAFPTDRLLQQFKYGGSLALAEWAGSRLAAAVRAHLATREARDAPDGIVALPLARSRQRERGFNQAREIAACVARETALPLSPSLARVGRRPPQAALRWSDRRQNVQGAFRVAGNVRGARIALVDDVMTTGATLAEAARTLREAGAARVECWVVARTLPPGA